jgi:hypothetical protein
MSYLINRNPSGRLLCLHGLLQYVHHHWGDGPYSITNFKFDAARTPDIHEFSPCASRAYGFRSCMYLDNPSSLAGCGLVNSVVEDSQKSKSASDIFNALDGLGFLRRNGKSATITKSGVEWIRSDRGSLEWELISRRAVRGYGPFAGLLFLAAQKQKQEIWYRKDIKLGFAETRERVVYEGVPVELTTGSKDDTITRSRSIMATWGVATGFFRPAGSNGTETVRQPSQVHYDSYLTGAQWKDGFVNTNLVYADETFIVERPLSYHQLVKSTRSIRERGQSSQRNASIHWEGTVKNRRLAIALLLSDSAETGRPVDFAKMLYALKAHPEFVVDSKQLDYVLKSELANAFVIGTPFTVLDGNQLLGMRQVDQSVLTSGAPHEVLMIIQTIIDSGSYSS